MSFNILYVEDEYKTWNRVEKAVQAQGGVGEADLLIIERAKNPEELKTKLNLRFDLVIADVCFRDPTSHELVPRLDDILNYVEQWSVQQHAGRSLPVIAYTGQGADTLKLCLKSKDRLFDIWDKNTATPEYVVWRLSEIVKKLSRIRPDAKMQSLIRQMPPGASWHKYVVEMTRRYDLGMTELDQIEKAGSAIESITTRMGVHDVCKPMWDVMVEWEPLSRAYSRGIRGHARHVINVFWLGYYLLHHEHLKGMFVQFWRNVYDQRRNMGAVADADPLEALSNAWFYAGLFHDVGGCVEKSSKVCGHIQKLLSKFDNLAPSSVVLGEAPGPNFVEKAKDWLYEFEKDLRDLILPVLQENENKKEPDQGVVGALYFREKITDGPQACYAREGARAMSMHNLFPKLDPKIRMLPVAWKDEPLVCLLLLCDQLQTWDRERGDETIKDWDKPSRAQLSDLSIGINDGRPFINMEIDYIAPAHLSQSPELYESVKRNLDSVLAEYPLSALNRIQKPWPFTLNVKCTLSGDLLDTEMIFGE